MKRTGLVNLICSLVAVAVLCLAVVLVLVFTDVINVVPEELVISSSSAVTTYDGKALVDDGWSLLEGELKKGHRLSVTVGGSQTNVGISENFIIATVYDENGADVTGDYKLVYKPGALNVKPRAMTLIAHSDLKLYDGEPLTKDEYHIEMPSSLVSGHSLVVTVEGSITDVGVAENAITSVRVLDNHGLDVTKNYRIETISGKLAVYPEESLLFETDDASAKYTGNALTDPDWRLVSGQLKPTDRLVVEVIGSQTDVGSSENNIQVTIYNNAGAEVTNEYTVVCRAGMLTVIPQELVIKSHSAQKVYDGEPLTEMGITVSPSHAYTDKISIFVETTGSQTEVGSSENTIGNAAIISKIGQVDITHNYDITYEYGTLTVTESDQTLTELEIKSGDRMKVYDGMPLTCESWEIVSGEFEQGHQPVVKFSGSLTDVGKADNLFTVEVYDGENNDVTDKYLITRTPGELEITPAEVTVRSFSDSKTYDGMPLTCDKFSVAPSAYGDRFEFRVDLPASQTEIGKTVNIISSVSVFDADGNEITDNFSIKKEEGELSVVAEDPKPVLVYSSGSASKTYDGTPLANGEGSRISGELMEGHTEVIEITTQITKAGMAENVITVRILEGETDVTDKYIINYETGTLEVTPKAITITTASNTKEYDGTPLTAPTVTVTPEDGIVAGDQLSATLSGSITLVGTMNNTLSSWAVTNQLGEDVSDCYEVQTNNGTLTVTPRVITITTASDEKFYNGTPLTNGNFVVEPAGEALVLDHKVNLTVTGTITDPGTVVNAIDLESFKIVNAAGDDYTGCYDVTIVQGLLTVHDAGSSDGTSLGLPEGYDQEDLRKIVILVINSDTDGKLYFREKSYGDFVGNGFKGAASYDEFFRGELSAYYINAYAILEKGTEASYIRIKSNSGQYVLPYYSLDRDAEVQGSDVTFIGSTDEEYYIYYLPEDGSYALSSELVAFEAEYEKFVRENYLDIDEKTLEFMLGVIKNNNFSLNDPDVVAKVASFMQNAAEYNLDYDRGLDSEENVAIAFLNKYGEGICQHYATAATMLYRALGIPARYTTGYVGTAKAGEDVNVTAAEAHAWVEIYKSGFGWVRVEVTGGSGGFPDKSPITVTVDDAEKPYDGTPLYPGSYTVEGLPTGFDIEVDISGSIIEPGTTNSVVTSYKIIDTDGNDVTEEYEVNTVDGSLTVTRASVTIVSNSNTKIYDGTPLTDAGATLKAEVSLNPSHRFDAEITGSVTEVGQVVNTVGSVTVYDELGQDVSSFYIIKKEEGTLTVTQRYVTVTAESDRKIFDGTPLENGNVEIDWGEEPPILTDIIVGSVVGSITMPDKIENILETVTVTNAQGKDVTYCYVIEIKNGTLEVLPIHITVSAANDSKFYDGTPLSNNGYTVDDEREVVPGHTVEAVIEGSGIEVGVYDNVVVSVKVVDAEGNDFTGGYVIEEVDGTLIVMSGDIVVVAHSAFKYFDGTPLEKSTYDIYSDTIDLSELEIDVVISGSITDPGKTANVVQSVKVYRDGTDVTDNYTIERCNGELEVKKRSVIITAASDEKYFDGTPLVKEEFEIESDSDLTGFVIEAEISGMQYEIGGSSNVVGEVAIYTEAGENVTEFFDIEKVDGWLEVKAIKISVTTYGGRKTYDGTPLLNDEHYVTSSVPLPDGHTITVKVVGSITEPGTAENQAIITVVDDKLGDLTKYYEIVTNWGTLEVTPIKINLTAATDVKKYDGTPLVNGSYTVDSEEDLLEGHTLRAIVLGTITDPGVEDNVIDSFWIEDEEGNNVTRYYDVTAIDGKLIVILEGITVIANSDRKTYDGTPLSNNGYTVQPEDALPEGFYVVATVEGEITRAGTVSNRVVSAILYDSEGEPFYDVEILTVDGVLTVDPIKFTLTANSDSKTYDGRYLVNSGVSMNPTDALLKGHELVVQVVSDAVEPGEWVNAIESYDIIDTLSGESVKDCYDVTLVDGTLIIHKIYLSLSAKSKEKVYDGKVLIYNSYSKSGELAPGHSLSVSISGSITEPGSVNNVISDIVITDASGNDVTDRYYEITTENGTLTVQQRNVTVIAGSKVKEYNGLPLTYNYYELEGDSFLEGHTLKVEISGSITEIGWIHNKVSSYVVLDEQGTDVTKYYNVETVDGVLEVVEEMIYFKLVLNSGKGKGTTDTVYLKMESLGNYDPLTNSWGTAPRYNKLIYDSESAYYLPAYGMEDSGITTYNLTINPVGGLFALPYYTFYDDTGSQQQSDTYLSGDAYYTYTVTYFKYGDNYFSNIELPEGELTQYEKDYREFVYKNYLDVDGETEAYLLEIIAAKGFNKNKASIINDVAKYIKSVARYKLDYDQSIDTAKNPVIEFFEKKEGVCRHYATAATLLFRTLGIPARYTTGFMGTATEGVETNVTTSMAHAWVEVYVDGKGWTRVEVTGTADGGVTFPVKMTVTPTATYAVYDGTVHNPTQSISGFNLGEYGYTYQVVVEGSSANLGYTTTRITNLIIHNSFGELVYDKEAGIGLDKFIITYKTGTLQNYISALSFRSDGFTKTYDGIEYVLTEEECHLISGTLAEGYTYVITPTTVMTDVGQDQNVFEVNIYKDGVLCNDHYRISRSYGTLKITNRSITIKAKDASKYYDGSALTCHEIEYLESELAEGDYIAAYEVSGSQTSIGKSVNQIVRIVIKNKNGKDVTSNYSLNTKTGILEVRIK